MSVNGDSPAGWFVVFIFASICLLLSPTLVTQAERMRPRWLGPPPRRGISLVITIIGCLLIMGTALWELLHIAP